MLRRFIILTSLAAGAAIAVTVALATPALAKGATQASITGPGLARPVTISAPGRGPAGTGGRALQPRRPDRPVHGALRPRQHHAAAGRPRCAPPPAAASLGPKYTVTYTVPGVTPEPGQADGQIRQDLYPRAAGGPVIYTLPGQQGFGQPLQATGWLRGTPQLTATLTRLGVPGGASLPTATASAATVPTATAPAVTAPAAAPKPDDTPAPALLIATIVSAIAIAIAGLPRNRRRRRSLATRSAGTRRPSAVYSR